MILSLRAVLVAAAVLASLLATGYGMAASPLLTAGAVVGLAVLAITVSWPLVVIGVMLAMGPVDISFLSGGQRELLPALGGLDMSGIRLMGISVGLGMVVLTRRELLRELGSPDARWYVIFLAWAALGLAFSPVPLEGVRLLLKLTYPLLVYLVVSSPRTGVRDIRRLGDWALWGATVVLLINPFFVANGGYAVEAGQSLRVSGPGSHYNPFSFYLLAILLLCVARFRTRGQARYLLLAGMAAVWMALTLTRITLLASFVAMTVVAVYTAVMDRNRRALLAIAVLGSVIGTMVIRGVLVRTFGYLPTPGQLLALAADPIGLYQAINWQGRETLWGILMVAVRANPLAGSGLGASSALLQGALGEGVAHNEYLRLAVDVGLLGCLLYFLAVAAWIVRVLRTVRSGPGSEEFTMPALAVIAAWAVIAVTDNAFDYYAPFTQYVAFLVAACRVMGRAPAELPTEAAPAPAAPVMAGVPIRSAGGPSRR